MVSAAISAPINPIEPKTSPVNRLMPKSTPSVDWTLHLLLRIRSKSIVIFRITKEATLISVCLRRTLLASDASPATEVPLTLKSMQKTNARPATKRIKNFNEAVLLVTKCTILEKLYNRTKCTECKITTRMATAGSQVRSSTQTATAERPSICFCFP